MDIPIHKYGNLAATVKAQTGGIQSSKKSQDKQDSGSFRGDSSTLSIDVQLLTARASVAKIAFREGEIAAGDPPEKLLQTAGKESALAFLQNPAELTPKNTANFIVRGITGYIYEAFKLNNPTATKEEFTEFQETTLSGFKAGLQEFRTQFKDENALNLTILEEMKLIEQLVQEDLLSFFEEALQQFT